MASLAGCTSHGYRVWKKDGAYYLSLGSEYNVYSYKSDYVEITVPAPCVYFDSMAEMVEDIRYGRFTDDEFDRIALAVCWFRSPEDEDRSLPLPDLSNLYAPVLPKDYASYCVTWLGDHYSFSSTCDTSKANFIFLDEAGYTDEINTCLLLIDARAEGVSVIPVGDTNYYVRERIYNSGGKCIYLYGSSCGQYFRVQITHYKEFPSTEFFASFGLKPYTG
jgi:hypothetical protein